MPLPRYAELHCLSNFSFLRGASHPEELVARAARLGYAALALTDECSLAGAVRAHQAAKAQGLKLIVGSEIRLCDGPKLVLLAMDRAGYGNLAQLITTGRRSAAKGEYRLRRADLADGVPGCLAILVPTETAAARTSPDGRDDAICEQGIAAEAAPAAPSEHGGSEVCRDVAGDSLEAARWLAATFPGRAWIAVERHLGPDDAARIARAEALARAGGLPLVACGDVHMHARGRRALQDLLTAIRLKTTLRAAGHALFPNGERHLRTRARLAALYRPEWLEESLRIAERCSFSLEELRYEYPDDDVPAGETASRYLRRLTEAGMAERWPGGAPPKVRAQVERELAIIAELGYEPYFLTVHDIVRHARMRGILCQGRGSAANSAVCYCLGITSVDPARSDMLFERFVSKERNEPPDIDIDFEHERREEVIQYIYARYGRERAALAATVICYRRRSALRDAGKALGLALDQVERLAANVAWWDQGLAAARIREVGLDPEAPVVQRLLALTEALTGFPRHLSQHVGGFVIARGPLSRLVPIENAAMPERTVIQWDKDDLDAMGLLKVDLLGLGMLSAIRRAFALVERHRGRRLTLADIPAEDPAVYAMIQKADTVGVFQIESRAQMSMLPRLKPANFYDLVIEVAIVRPGPIQGQMVHPYLKRRQGLEPVTYPSEEVRAVLARTLGVPIFQEQVIKLAMVAAGFSGGEADQLRRAIGSWRKRDTLERFRRRLLEGLRARGYDETFAERIYQQIQGFGEYGFPESHAASFALLVYVSAWLKRHEPAAFACALLNSQPMGFYAPAQLVQDARRHGVEVRPVDVTVSEWDCSLEADGEDPSRASSLLRDPSIHDSPLTTPPTESPQALRLGLRMVKGLSAAAAGRIRAARAASPFVDVQDLTERARLDKRDRDALAAAGALSSLAGDRHRARWAARGAERSLPLFPELRFDEEPPALTIPTEGEDLVADYASLGLSLGRHPLALLRPQLARLRTLDARALHALPHGRRARYAGLVVTRQHPASAKGTIFLTLEDETGSVNVIVWPSLVERFRKEILHGRLLLIRGELQREGEVLHLVAAHIEDHSPLLGRLDAPSRDFC